MGQKVCSRILTVLHSPQRISAFMWMLFFGHPSAQLHHLLKLADWSFFIFPSIPSGH